MGKYVRQKPRKVTHVLKSPPHYLNAILSALMIFYLYKRQFIGRNGFIRTKKDREKNMKSDGKLEIGDVIKGDLSWAFSHASSTDGAFTIRQHNVSPALLHARSKAPRISESMDERSYKELAKKVKKAGAKLNGQDFVVTDASSQASGGGHNDPTSYDWHIIAQAVNGGVHKPDNFKIEFFQYEIRDINLVGKMQRTFVPI